jgi:hypothetical protein
MTKHLHASVFRGLGAPLAGMAMTAAILAPAATETPCDIRNTLFRIPGDLMQDVLFRGLLNE